MYYATLYNKQTGGTDDYVIVKEDDVNYFTVLPITYYWLVYLGKVEKAAKLNRSNYKDFFVLKGKTTDLDKHLKRYIAKYGRYYFDLELNELEFEYLENIGSFIELFEGYPELSLLDRIEMSVFTPNLNNCKYIEVIKPVIEYVMDKNKVECEENKLKFLLSDIIQQIFY